MDNAIQPANRAVRRAQDAQGLPVSPRGVTKRPEPIRWVKVNANTESASFGPWVVSVTQLPSLSAMDPPNYSVAIEAVDEKAPAIHDETQAKIFAVRLLALALKSGITAMVEHGVIGVRGEQQPGPGEKK